MSSRLAHAIITDPRDAVRLTGQERCVLELIATGPPHRAAARIVHIDEDTTRTYRKRSIEGVPDRARRAVGGQLAWRAVAGAHIDLVPPPSDDLPDTPAW